MQFFPEVAGLQEIIPSQQLPCITNAVHIHKPYAFYSYPNPVPIGGNTTPLSIYNTSLLKYGHSRAGRGAADGYLRGESIGEWASLTKRSWYP